MRRGHRLAADPGARGERSAQRAQLYREAVDKFGARRNILYLYHANYIVAFPKNFKGYKAVPDGLVRVKGASWN